MTDRVLSLIGLARKAGMVSSGEYAVTEDGRSGRAFAIIIACDASARSIKTYTDMCKYYEIPYELYGSKESLGHAIGKEERSAIAVLEENFANNIISKIHSLKGEI